MSNKEDFEKVISQLKEKGYTVDESSFLLIDDYGEYPSLGRLGRVYSVIDSTGKRLLCVCNGSKNMGVFEDNWVTDHDLPIEWITAIFYLGECYGIHSGSIGDL